RRGAARPALAGPRGHLADRRALRQRRHGRQPQPDRAAVLLGIHADLHPGVAVAGNGYRPRRPGRGDTPAGRGDRGWVHAIPAGRRDAVQPGARSPSVRTRMEPAATPAPSALVRPVTETRRSAHASTREARRREWAAALGPGP